MASIKALLFAGTCRSVVYSRVCRELKKKDAVVDVLVCGSEADKWYRRAGGFGEVIDIMQGDAGRRGIRTLAEIPPDCPIYEFVEGDRNLRRTPFAEIERIVVHHYNFLSRLVEEGGYDCFTGEIGNLIANLIAYLSGKNGTSFVWPMLSFWPDCFFLSSENSRFALADQVARSYEETKRAEPGQAELAMAAETIERYRKAQIPVMPHMSDGKRHTPVLVSLRKKAGELKSLAGLIGSHLREHRTNYFLESCDALVDRKLYAPMRRKNALTAAKFEQPVPGEPNLLFFLHFEPDLSTLVWAPQFTNQIDVVKNIALSMPNGFRLYVKEHPLSVGSRRSGYYEQLRDIPAVRLIAPGASRGDLLEGTSAVVTITGTIGWEALIRRKPVVTLGNVFYNCYEGCHFVRSWYELRSTLHELVENPALLPDADLARFVASVRRCTRPGDYFGATQEQRDDPANTTRLADSFYEAMLSSRARGGVCS